MKLYIDESGSLTQKIPKEKNFIIALVLARDQKQLARAHKRFISTNHDQLRRLDDRSRQPKMFRQGRFYELKGSQLDRPMKEKFVRFFCQKPHWELYYIQVHNHQLPARFFDDTNASFNYLLRQALDYFFHHQHLAWEACQLELDNRNEKIENQNFLARYLNTELVLAQRAPGPFHVDYFDSSRNRLVQVADVLANLYYSQLLTHFYDREIKLLEDQGILKTIYHFPQQKES